MVSTTLVSLKSLSGRGLVAQIVILNAMVSCLCISLIFYSIANNNEAPIDAVCLFYIISHCVPIVYTITVRKKNARKKSI